MMPFRMVCLLAPLLLPTLAFFFQTPAPPPHKAEAVPQTALITQCSIRNDAFEPGEELVYKLYYNWNFVWMAAGEVVFRVRDLGDRYHVSAHGSTYPSYEWFYKVNDKYDTYLDKKTLLPTVSVRSVAEGKYRLYDKLTFDRPKNTLTSLRGKSRDSATPSEYPVEPCVHDLLSIIYFARNIDFSTLEKGSAVPIKIFMDQTTWPLRLRYQGKNPDKHIHKLGRFKTILFSPDVIKGYVFKEEDKLKVWASDDKNHLPLLIESPISVGSVKVVLKSYSGLKYPLSAKVAPDEGSPDGTLPKE
ncbi:MAG: hypothetical protein RL181_672 [Bacteroidota bacterium]|jgi:hypothetical protein